MNNERVKLIMQDVLSILYRLFWIFKIDRKKIICINFSGRGYGDSPKYVIEQLLNKNPNYKVYWVFNGKGKVESDFHQVKYVKRFSIKHMYCMATSKIWISNNRIEHYFKKRKNQIYIQTWHGGIALKKIEYDAEDKLSRIYKKTMKSDNKNIDFMISNSRFCTEMYRNAFRYDGEILEYGTPKNDLLINNKQDAEDNVRKFFGLKDEKILLYAPTFRKNYDSNPYDIDFKRLQSLLEEKNTKWKIFIRLHPIVKNPEKLISNYKNYVNACNYPDIQELICSSDLIITDYSSVMFDGMIAGKPVVLYARDIDSYKDERGYYFSFESLPFPLSKNNRELFELFKNNNLLDNISGRYSSFEKKIGLMEKGHSSEKVSALIEKLLNGEDDG